MIHSLYHYQCGKSIIMLSWIIVVDLKIHLLFIIFPLKLRFPFDWKNPFGYSIATITEFWGIAYALKLTAILHSIGLGMFLISIAEIKDIKNQLRQINKWAKAEENPIRILTKLTELIQYHSDVKELSIEKNNYDLTFFAQCTLTTHNHRKILTQRWQLWNW